MIIEGQVRERSVSSMSRFDPVIFFTSDPIREDAANVRIFVDNFYWLSVDVDADVHCCLSGSRLDDDLRLFYIDLHPKRL